MKSITSQMLRRAEQCFRKRSLVTSSSLGSCSLPRNSSSYQQHPTTCAFSSSSSASNRSSSDDDNTNSALNNSVSSEEVSKFSAMANTWWKVDHNPLISMNPIRMSFILQQIAIQHKINIEHTSSAYKPLLNLKALDVGCGGGLLSESLARLGANVTAVDPSEEVAQAARIHSMKHSDTKDIDYKGGMSVEKLANMKEYRHSFDIVCVLEVIEHATDPKSLMQGAISLLKQPTDTHPGGMLFVSTINRTAKSYAVAIVGGEYLTQKLPIGTHDWRQFLSPKEVNLLVREFGMEEVDKKGMILKPPFWDLKWYLDSNDFDVNWIGSYMHK